MYSDLNKEIFLAYAVHNDRRFEHLTDYNPKFQQFVIDTISHVDASKSPREMTVANYMGLDHNFEINGPDAWNKRHEPLEIKTEQPCRKTMAGTSTWHYKKEEGLKDLAQQRCIQSGFKKGRMVYVVSFNLTDSTEIFQRMISGHKKNKDKDGLKMHACTWRDFPSLRLHFLNERYMDRSIINETLFDTLEDLAERFQNSADII